MYFDKYNFTGPENTYESPQGETDDEADYENADTFVRQKDDSDNSDHDYININAHEQRSDVDNVYESVV